MSTVTSRVSGSSVGVASSSRRPAAVSMRRDPALRCCDRSTAWARQRMPLPEISATDPSLLCSTMCRSADEAFAGARPHRRPSAPMPRRRSQRATATDGSGWMPSGWSAASATRKSLPRPWCLVSRTSLLSHLSFRVVRRAGSSGGMPRYRPGTVVPVRVSCHADHTARPRRPDPVGRRRARRPEDPDGTSAPGGWRTV